MCLSLTFTSKHASLSGKAYPDSPYQEEPDFLIIGMLLSIHA